MATRIKAPTNTDTTASTDSSLDAILLEMKALRERVEAAETRASEAEVIADLASKARTWSNPLPTALNKQLNAVLTANYEKLVKGEKVNFNLFSEPDPARSIPRTAVFCVMSYRGPQKEGQNGFFSLFIPTQNFNLWMNNGEVNADGWVRRSPNKEARQLAEFKAASRTNETSGT